MDNNKNQSSKKTPKENTIRNEVTQIVSSAYKFLEDWVRPKKGQSPFVQIIVFILKLPVLLLLLMLSPVLLVVLMLIFLIAL